MKKKILIHVFLFALLLGITLLNPSTSGASDTFKPTYVAPGYTASDFLTLNFRAFAIEFDCDENLYCWDASEYYSDLDSTERTVLKMDLATGIVSDYVSFSTDVGRLVTGLDFDTAGNLFISEGYSTYPPPGYDDSGRISKIKISDGTITAKEFLDFRPTGIATGKTGTNAEVYFPGRKWSAGNWGNIYKIDSFPGSEDVLQPGIVATGIAIDDYGNIFLARTDNSTDNPIYFYGPTSTIRIAAFNRMVEELNFDCHGNLYAIEPFKADDPTTSIIQLSEGGIDIKPGVHPNCFNQNEHGVIPVAIFGSPSIDVNEIEVNSLFLQGLIAKIAGKSNKYLAHTEDINGDGYLDLIVQFQDSDGWVEPGNGYIMLAGSFSDGRSFWAGDTICIVPPEK